jgi:hypothetical protein
MSESAKALRVYVAWAVIVIVAAVWYLVLTFVLPSQRIWYFGNHNERVFAVEDGCVYWGDSSSYPRASILGRVPVVFAFLLSCAVPIWFVDRQMTKWIKGKEQRQREAIMRESATTEP